MEYNEDNFKKLVKDNETLTTNATKATSDMATMQTSITALEENARLLKQEKTDAKEAARIAAHEATKKGGDVEALEASWQQKYDTDLGARDETITGLNGMIGTMTAGAAALTMANGLAVEGQAEGLLPHIKSRLTTEIKDGKPTVRVLGKDGKPSAMTLDDLKAEIIGTGYLASMISGSKASGGDIGGKGSNAGKEVMKRPAFDALSQLDKSAFLAKANKGEAVLTN